MGVKIEQAIKVKVGKGAIVDIGVEVRAVMKPFGILSDKATQSRVVVTPAKVDQSLFCPFARKTPRGKIRAAKLFSKSGRGSSVRRLIRTISEPWVS